MLLKVRQALDQNAVHGLYATSTRRSQQLSVLTNFDNQVLMRLLCMCTSILLSCTIGFMPGKTLSDLQSLHLNQVTHAPCPWQVLAVGICCNCHHNPSWGCGRALQFQWWAKSWLARTHTCTYDQLMNAAIEVSLACIDVQRVHHTAATKPDLTCLITVRTQKRY